MPHSVAAIISPAIGVNGKTAGDGKDGEVEANSDDRDKALPSKTGSRLRIHTTWSSMGFCE